MLRYFGTLAVGVLIAGTASAQFPGSAPIFPPQYAPNQNSVPPTVMQNYYNRANQPLSPYLNLLRNSGNFPAVDYYYGVRPGLPSGGQPYNQQPQQQRGNSLAGSQMRTGYIPQAGIATGEDQQLPDANRDVILPSSGHSVAYGNVYGVNRTGVPGSNGANGKGFFQAPTTGTSAQKSAGKSPKK